MLSSPIFLAFVAPPNTCGTPTCPVPHCAKCGGGAHGTPQFCLQCCPGFTPVATPPYTYCSGSPAIYWQSSPTVANSTLLIAGASLTGATASLCTDATCTSSTPLSAETWELSAQILLPATLAPPASIKLGSAVVQLNVPEIWWASRGEPAAEPLAAKRPALSRAAAIYAGQTLRVFGRSLAWTDATTCTAATAPSSSTKTTLSLGGSISVAASAATCYDATFSTVTLPVGAHQATIVTEWGASAPFQLAILAPPTPPSPPTAIDVDRDCGGNVKTALTKAAALLSPAVVRLGARSYTITEPLTVPNKTALVGAGGASVLDFALPLPPAGGSTPNLPAALTASNDVTLANFTITIGRATPRQYHHPPYAGVWMPPQTARFSARGLNVTLSYLNVSNAMRIEGHGFEVVGNVLVQEGPCNVGAPHPGDQFNRPFQPSVTLYLHAAREGRIAHNEIRWRCSAFDLDVSERVVFEENTVTLIDNGNIPHGNSLSMYDYVHHPWSRGWLVARNTFTRPPCRGAVGSGGQCGGDPSLGLDNWLQRETLTTDGSGAWAVGHLAAAAGATVQLRWTAWTNAPVPGTRLLIVDGPGLGQSRTVVGTPANGTLVLDDPLDGHATVNASLAVVLTDASDKAIVGNSFSWSNVIQAYGSTYRYVAADNTISNGNFRQHHAGATGGVLGAAGECYHGIATVFFTEFLNNKLTDSNGLNLRDGGNAGYPMCGDYGGPWIRWSVIRGNSLSGISLAAINTTAPGETPHCAQVNVVNKQTDPSLATTDVVTEHQHYTCSSGFTPGATSVSNCAHCVVR